MGKQSRATTPLTTVEAIWVTVASMLLIFPCVRLDCVGRSIQLCNKPTTSTKEGRETWAGKIAQTERMNTFTDQTLSRHVLLAENTRSSLTGGKINSMLATMGVRPCVTAKLPVLRPWFWNLILLNLAAASCYFIASLGGRVRCKHPFSLEDAKCEIASVQHLRAAYVQTVEQFAQRASETGEQSFAMETF